MCTCSRKSQVEEHEEDKEVEPVEVVEGEAVGVDVGAVEVCKQLFL